MKNGTAPIFPWRAGRSKKRRDKETHDRHGVKRCKHCGGPMIQVRFAVDKDKPCLWFRCEDGKQTPGCAGEQRIYCEDDWRSLIPLARTEPLYHELKASHQTYEAVHDYWRDRYGVAADTLAIRPKAVGLEWHRLRAYVACAVDWLRIGTLNGWLDSATDAAKKARKAGERRFKKPGEEVAAKLAKMRVRMGLAAPYGPQAAKLGLGDATPPSERPRAKSKTKLALARPGP
jgi:hypothetical protein